jgi:hypothetical protein
LATEQGVLKKTKSLTRVRMIFSISTVLILLLMAAVPGRVDAYVLEGPHVLDLSAKSMGRIAALQVEQKLLVYPQSPETFPTVFDETAIYVMPERFRSDIASERIQRTFLVFADSSLTVIDGRTVVGENPFDLYQRLLRSRTRPRLIRTLNQMGVETAISSLGRLEERVVFVLGARYPDESVSQLAIDKETFLPARLLLVDGNAEDGGRRLEIVYENWQKVQSGWFPFQVQFYVNGRLAREIRVADLRINPSIPSSLMDLGIAEGIGCRKQRRDTPGAKAGSGRGSAAGGGGLSEKIE